MSIVCLSLDLWRELRRSPEWAGRSVGFVPTMGGLHAGHVALLERARAENERVVLSIFVNPTQFNDPADLEKYPRTPEADLALARPLADAVLLPSEGQLYPGGYHCRMTETDLARRWEGAHRPGHFDGVLTVVLKLLNLVQPARAYFGEKDWQQLLLVRRMAEDFFLPCDIVGCPTVREADGLAQSTRNRRLSAEGRQLAAEFPRALRLARTASEAIVTLKTLGFAVDYVEDHEGRRLGAVRLEGVRLIDNLRVSPDPCSSAST